MNWKTLLGVTTALSLLSPITVAQESSTEISDELVCLRYVRAYERNQNIPQGLLTAISYVESGREVPSIGRTVPWPWTINAAGRSQYFDTKEEAVETTLNMINEGIRSIDVGCMQINLRYHPNAFRSLEEAFEPSANVAYGAQHLKTLRQNLGSWPQAVERYHSSDDGRRTEYRERVLAFWEDDARKLIFDEVEQEDTDTPYHRAYKDFTAGRYQNAALRYRDVLNKNPNDKVALMGIALTSTALGQPEDALSAYERVLVVDPGNELVEARVLEAYAGMPVSEAISRLTDLIDDGAGTPSLFAALAQYTQGQGQTEDALKYFSAAAKGAPGVAAYQLNAAVLADQLRRPATAVAFYEEFLRLYRGNPVVIDTSIDGVKNRVRYLKTVL